MSRLALHDLIDRIPEEELPVAKRFLEYLAASPAYRAALSAPPDDEPVSEADAAAIVRVREELRTGKVVSQDDFLREFGLR
ncbi:MAG: hypothetical protein LAP87_21185 [Acidobacteriia bacterium]|nr:hypothetical protein [Terriglobia bacterium]